MRWARTPHQGAGPAVRREGRDAGRRDGGVAEDELLLAMPPEEFVRGIEGLEGLGKSGFRYRIPPYGAHMDPSAGMNKRYQLRHT